ncbi:MAG: pyrroline-5-carboxylate reductase [Eubacteriales bacterium]|nr:pyrroline-5-carboxylate reductase [Eubacteriales bacterium]
MKLGFIGCGNMAGAIIRGIISSGIVKPEEIIGADLSAAAREKVERESGIVVTADNTEVVRRADTVFLTVKPQYLEEVIFGIREEARPEQLFVSIAAGRSVSWIEERFEPYPLRLVRLMPNTPALVGEGMTAACANARVTPQEMEEVCRICGAFGKVQETPESLFDVVTAVSGSSPAYVFILIEAMADAAVQGGMPRAMAYRFASQAVLGSAKMVLETGKHPGELKDMVTSPAGTTIEAVRVLEEKGFRSAVFECVKACAEKSASL